MNVSSSSGTASRAKVREWRCHGPLDPLLPTASGWPSASAGGWQTGMRSTTSRPATHTHAGGRSAAVTSWVSPETGVRLHEGFPSRSSSDLDSAKPIPKWSGSPARRRGQGRRGPDGAFGGRQVLASLVDDPPTTANYRRGGNPTPLPGQRLVMADAETEQAAVPQSLPPAALTGSCFRDG